MPQDYVVSIQKSSVQQKWTYNRKVDSQSQVFPVTASFQFVKLDPAEAEAGTTVETNTF